jgi:MFS family permease
MLMLVFTLNYLDRGLIVLLLQPIKVELGLSDTQLGFLTGIAFGLFYATLGVPIARWADRGNRVTITSIAIGLWGLTVMACLLVSNFFQLVCARVAAAVGESGCMPPTYSLLGDYFPGAAERSHAMSVYWLAGPLASLISFVAGGWLNEQYGWRLTFLIMGIPALVVAVLVKLTIAEPRLQTAREKAQEPLPPMSEVLRLLWQRPAARHLTVALILLFLLALGLGPWYAAFMMRSHGMQTGELGLWLGLIFGGGGVLGLMLGGYVAGRWFALHERRQMRVTAWVIAALVPCFVLFLLLPHKIAALMALAPLVIAFNFVFGPTFALLQRLVRDDMRATTLAVVMLLANLIGMGLGPQIVGIVSDVLAPIFASDSLRYAMLGMSLFSLWTAYEFWQVGETVEAELSAVSDGRHGESPGVLLTNE